MIFNKHSNLAGQHAFLSASNNAWSNYTDDKLITVFRNLQAAKRGTELHQFAHDAIRLGIRLPRSPKTLHLYVNDAIGYRMTPEQILYYSENCYGTADAVAFRKGKLRIHDLKTGLNHTNERQLEIYAALFCLEYGVKPHDIEMELRIYQSNEVRIYDGEPDVIVHLMDRIITFDKIIEQMRMEELS